ncbi:ead/Ea22-like family protein, partial [Klebsiella variicola]
MTDITELAQRMRTAAEKAGIEQWVNNRGEVNTADYEVDGGMYIDHICDCEIVGTESPRAEFIALANPANILALVKALEKAKGMETYWKTQCRGITDHCE